MGKGGIEIGSKYFLNYSENIHEDRKSVRRKGKAELIKKCEKQVAGGEVHVNDFITA